MPKHSTEKFRNSTDPVAGEKGAAPEKRTSPSTHRFLKWLSVVAVSFAALFLLGLALLFHVTPPPVVHIDPAAAQRLTEEIKRAEAEVASGKTATILADETEINSAIAVYLRAPLDRSSSEVEGGVRDIKLSMSHERLRIYALLNLHGKDISILLEGKVRTVDGRLDFQPISGRIGAVPLPRSTLVNALNRAMTDSESRSFLQLPPNVRDVKIEDGKIAVVYR